MAQLQHQQQQQNNNPQQLQQHALSNQQSQSSNHNLHQQDKMGGAGSVTVDGSMSNSFRGNDQVSPFYVTSKHIFLRHALLLVLSPPYVALFLLVLFGPTIFEKCTIVDVTNFLVPISTTFWISVLLFMCTT